ncbi:gephyrin-like molybdotransferase Glp [Alkalimonas amylolytica]|uniref:Molybdopterin molybdenumtransferase n=1 Tax=Alkalimonas amylolytica TaxID=152573 RepID=A0A1H3ZKD0_ALKAM|nr:gephyrin-like molybdotransferase Glp [Alkalimonas amylolytica]SEA23881.1 molybdopterin molybdotransferase [Alkalimonas amylolytica]
MSLMPVQDALDAMLSQVSPLAGVEYLGLAAALGRVLVKDIRAEVTVPAFDNSAMDGYAVRLAEAEPGKTLPLAGTALAGHAFEGEVPPDHCVRITTGAVLPAGLDTVVMQEQVEQNGQGIRLLHVPKLGEHVRKAGEDIAPGQLLLSRGQRLTAVDLGLLASIGLAEVAVQRCIKAAVFSTGDELIAPGQPLPAGHLYDSNRVVLSAMLKRLDCEVLDLGLLPDKPDRIRQAIQRAAEEADVLITSAGVSVGDADYTRKLLSELGDIGFWKVAMKPGKPFAFGSLGKCWFFGLPGNPVAAVATMDLLVQPVLRRLAGEPIAKQQSLEAVAAESMKKAPGRADFQRGFYQQLNGQLQVKPIGRQSSAVLSGTAKANCYIALEQERSQVEAGETVRILPFYQMLR